MCGIVWEIKKNLAIDVILKWEIAKDSIDIKKGINIVIYVCMGEKLAIASYNNHNDLIKGRKFFMFVDI